MSWMLQVDLVVLVETNLGIFLDNTNITNVVKPGGSYNKWVLSGQDNNYLPHWMNAAGYRTECKSSFCRDEFSDFLCY